METIRANDGYRAIVDLDAAPDRIEIFDACGALQYVYSGQCGEPWLSRCWRPAFLTEHDAQMAMDLEAL